MGDMITVSIMKALEVAKKFSITVIVNSNLKARGHYSWGRKIEIRPDADAYAILHEVGHMIAGYGCCREHDEYIAHGIAIGLSKANRIKIPKKRLLEIDVYAGRTSHDGGCAAIERWKMRYWCAKCKRYHVAGSMAGRNHKVYSSGIIKGGRSYKI